MLNKAILLGRVGKIDIKPLSAGTFTSIGLATTKKSKDVNGTKVENTTWHQVNCFGKLSEIASKYVKVGSLLLIEGEIQNKRIESGERAGQYMYSIVCTDMKFVPGTTASPKPTAVPAHNQQSFQDDAIPF